MFTVNRNWPLWVISTQHGAVWLSAKGLAPTDVSAPLNPTLKADMVPVPAPTLWALETNSCWGPVGRNSLPKGPSPWAEEGDPGAAVRRPALPTTKLSINDEPTRVPTRLLPVELKSTSPGWELFGRETVELASGCSCPKKFSVNPV